MVIYRCICSIARCLPKLPSTSVPEILKKGKEKWYAGGPATSTCRAEAKSWVLRVAVADRLLWHANYISDNRDFLNWNIDVTFSASTTSSKSETTLTFRKNVIHTVTQRKVAPGLGEAQCAPPFWNARVTDCHRWRLLLSKTLRVVVLNRGFDYYGTEFKRLGRWSAKEHYSNLFGGKIRCGFVFR